MSVKIANFESLVHAFSAFITPKTDMRKSSGANSTFTLTPENLPQTKLIINETICVCVVTAYKECSVDLPHEALRPTVKANSRVDHVLN
jgi:hypothetical protein